MITSEEFTQLYQEWLRKRDILPTALINVKSYYTPNEYGYLLSLAQNHQVHDMIVLLQSQFNRSLCSAKEVGSDAQGKVIAGISEKWIEEVEELFTNIDTEGRGCVDAERVQFFLMALLMNEIKTVNKDEMVLLIQK